MSLLKVALLGISAVLIGCASTTRGTKNAAPSDIAAEVARICALPPGEREKALERLKQDSGMVLFCGSKE
jgi:hypothetical protein